MGNARNPVVMPFYHYHNPPLSNSLYHPNSETVTVTQLVSPVQQQHQQPQQKPNLAIYRLQNGMWKSLDEPRKGPDASDRKVPEAGRLPSRSVEGHDVDPIMGLLTQQH